MEIKLTKEQYENLIKIIHLVKWACEMGLVKWHEMHEMA